MSQAISMYTLQSGSEQKPEFNILTCLLLKGLISTNNFLLITNNIIDFKGEYK